LITIVEYVQKEHEGSKIRVSFVGYRDHCDKKTRFSIIDFTENLEEVKIFISKTEASGGGDTPEDIAGAFKNALAMKWESKARYAVLVSDAPCHGKKYHSVDDSYPNGDPDGLIPE